MNDGERLQVAPFLGTIARNWQVIFFSIVYFYATFSGAAATSAFAGEALVSIVPVAAPLLILAPDTAVLEQQWKQSAFFALYAEPVMQPFWDDLRKNKGGVLPTERLGLSWSELREVSPDGAALIAWPAKDNSLAYVFIADSTSKPAPLSTVRDQVRQTWQKRGFEISSRKVQAVDVVEARIKPNEVPASSSKSKPNKAGPTQAAPTNRFLFIHEGRLVICDRESVIPDIVDRLSGKVADCLKKSAVFSQLFSPPDKSPAGTASLLWFVDPWQLYRGVVDQKAKSNRGLQRSYSFLQRQGFEAVKAFGGAISFGTDGSDLDYETRIVVAGPLKKGSGVLSFAAAKDLKSPGWLPQTLTDLSTMTLQPKSVVKAYGAIYDEIYGENYDGAFNELLDSIETEPDGPEARVRRDLLECMQPYFVWASDFAGQKSDSNPSGKRQLIVATTSCEDKSLVAVQRFFANDDQIRGERQGEAWVWQSREAGQSLFPYNSKDPMSIKIDALAVYKQYIVVSSDRALIQETIRVVNDNASSNRLPVMFANQITGAVCGKSYRKTSAHLKCAFDLVRDGRLQKSTSWESMVVDALLMSDSVQGGEATTVGRDSLPPYEEVKSEFGVENSEIVMTTGGWIIRGSLKKHRKQ